MDEEERHGEISDEEMQAALKAEERIQCAPRPWSWGRLFVDWLDNTGKIAEHIGEYPLALSRNVWAHVLYQEDQQDFAAGAAAEIEKMTEGNHGEWRVP